MKRLIAAFLLTGFFIFCPGAMAAAQNETRVFDQGNLLAPSAVADLENRAADFRQRYRMDLVILTTTDTRGKTSRAFADDFYDDNDFGSGSDKSGLLLLIDMDNRQAYISTSGRAIATFTDYRIERILDAQFPKLKSGDYYNAFLSGIGATSGMIEQDLQRGSSSSAFGLSFWEQIGLSALIGLVAGGIVTAIVSFRYRKDFLPAGINDRLEGNLNLTARDDVLVDTRITTRKIEKDRDSGGGSSTHSSSSGRTHGGGGRSF